MLDESKKPQRELIDDNAGGGARGRRARPSVELYQAVSRSYGIDHLDDSVDLGGSSCLNLLVTDDHGRHVVRVYRPYVSEARIRDVWLVRETLKAAGVPSAELLPTLDGRPWIVFDGRLVEVERYIEHDTSMNTWEHLMVGLPWLGRMHTVTQRIQSSPDGKRPLFANYIEPHKALDMTLQGTRRIRSWNPPSAYLRFADAAEELAYLVSAGERESSAILPRQMVHGDYWDNNVLFREGRIVLVNDFDFMGERARIDDLALTLYYFDCSDKPMSEERLRRLRSLIDAYDEGLDEHLSNVERLALPLAMARQPLWSVGGWIALLDDEEIAWQHTASVLGDVDWALRIMHDLDRWQATLLL